VARRLLTHTSGTMTPTLYSSFAPALAGGALIGLAGSLLLVLVGRVAGISGIVGGVLHPRAGELGWRLWFVAGLILGGLALRSVDASLLGADVTREPVTLLIAGLLVGAGTRLGSGCTSGHGVCGISRFSVRSIVATCVFLAVGMLTASLVSVWSGP
jgi:uncharacterized membrane protein YedE/YeeE